jgi:phytoene synthase
VADDVNITGLMARLRQNDRERFQTALFAPASRRESLFALYLFNYEMARIRELVSEPLLGRIRLQWWRDSVAEIYDGRPWRRHEALLPLGGAILARDLSRVHFDRLIDAREADMADEPPASLAALEAYAEGTSGSLVLLALEALGVRDPAATAVGKDIGVAYALAGLLRAVPFHARARRLYLPADLLAASGRDLARELYDLKPSPALLPVVAAVAARARARLAAARARRHEMPRSALPALLPGVLAKRALDRLARAGNDVFAPRLLRPNGVSVARLTLAAWVNRY